MSKSKYDRFKWFRMASVAKVAGSLSIPVEDWAWEPYGDDREEQPVTSPWVQRALNRSLPVKEYNRS